MLAPNLSVVTARISEISVILLFMRDTQSNVQSHVLASSHHDYRERDRVLKPAAVVSGGCANHRHRQNVISLVFITHISAFCVYIFFTN